MARFFMKHMKVKKHEMKLTFLTQLILLHKAVSNLNVEPDSLLETGHLLSHIIIKIMILYNINVL